MTRPVGSTNRNIGATRAFDRLDWQDQAACAGMDTDLFYGDHEVNNRLARAICKPCPVRDACLAYAIENREIGVWGGTTDDDRRRLRRPLRVSQARAARYETERQALVDEVTFLLDAGTHGHVIATRLGRQSDSIDRRLREMGRYDLAARFRASITPRAVTA